MLCSYHYIYFIANEVITIIPVNEILWHVDEIAKVRTKVAERCLQDRHAINITFLGRFLFGGGTKSQIPATSRTWKNHAALNSRRMNWTMAMKYTQSCVYKPRFGGSWNMRSCKSFMTGGREDKQKCSWELQFELVCGALIKLPASPLFDPQ